MRQILATGHTGFIGSYLVNILQSKKYQVIGVSHKIDKNLRITQIKKNVRNIDEKNIQDNIFCIVHLSAITDIEYCQKEPVKCMETNLMGTQNMLEIARKKDCKFVYMSTSHVYGNPQRLPIDEDHPRNPISMYASSKLGGELCCEAYSKAYGMDISIVRPFSVYGPNEKDYFVIPKILSQLINNDVIKLGNLHPRRDFIYVTDVAYAIETIIRKSKGFNVYNIGTGESHSILEVYNILKKISRTDKKIVSIKKQIRKLEIDNIVADISRIRRLGWRPHISLHQGLELCFNQFRQDNT